MANHLTPWNLIQRLTRIQRELTIVAAELDEEDEREWNNLKFTFNSFLGRFRNKHIKTL